MKQYLVFLIIVFLLFGLNTSINAQIRDLIVFSDQGNPFTLVLNGEEQNSEPLTNVKVTELTAPNYRVKIIFDDKSINSIEKNLYLKPDYTVTYRIRDKKNGNKVLRFYSEELIVYGLAMGEMFDDSDEPDNGYADVNVNIEENGTNSVLGMDVIADDNNVSVRINVNGESVGVDIHADENSANAGYNDYHENGEYDENYVRTEEVYLLEGYNGKIGCQWPMNPQEFARAKQSVNNKSFDSDKMIIAKQIISANCMLTNQVKQIVELFDFESDKLKFAKYAYSYTFDIENYYQVNDVFSFSSSIKELDQHINSLH